MQWCSDEQYLRLHCRRDDDPCLPSVFLKMVVVVDACNKPSTPRTPSLPCPHPQPERDSHQGQVPMQQACSQGHETHAPAVSLEVPGLSSTDRSDIDNMVEDFLVDSTPTTSTELDDSFCQAERGVEVISRQAAIQQPDLCPSLQELVAELCHPDNQPPSSDDSPRQPIEPPEVPIWGSPPAQLPDTSDGEGADLSALPARHPAGRQSSHDGAPSQPASQARASAPPHDVSRPHCCSAVQAGSGCCSSRDSGRRPVEHYRPLQHGSLRYH